jgi:hypothetical protein
MEDPAFAYLKCPACEGTILDRGAERCIYCGVMIPPELLLPAEELVRTEKQEEKRTGDVPPQSDDQSDVVEDVIDVIDIISDIGDLFD